MRSILLATVILTMTAMAPHADLSDRTYDTWVTDRGEISLPRDFRKDFAHLGSWFVPEGDASGFHDVYTQPEAVAHYRKTGTFPDGAVIVKELRANSGKPMTTGHPEWANDTLKQWFVMVKDGKNRFPGNASWGDGWGWALFQPGKKGNQSTNYKSDCLGCHIPAKATDWIYVEGYPTLSGN
ncbi:Cytochrome P460 family protein [Sulfidibacter corallicola]|uniref:Cytochrome P460 family protein n=1 Tax=Sulfidibacter corallicola TaxID=2818388 RepID=A0A8A4TI65_SULCO|nr:cytochrome P460 family protein [Sulfidibacter corallicola]QTD49739.1 cytochrome P460 family protein [Sulfidibacter corallicola]